MAYLLDTNACIALINGAPGAVRDRFETEISSGASFNISAIAIFELQFGVAKSTYPDRNRQRLRRFLDTTMPIIEFDGDDAASAGEIRAHLSKRGMPIGPYDLLIAAQAHRRKYTLITANVREFRRIDGLKWEDWTKGG